MVRRIVLGLAAAVLAVTSASAHAQAMPSASARFGSISGGVAYSLFQPDYGTGTLNGITGYIDANFSRRWGLEIETHRMIHNATSNMSEITYSIGPRYTISRGSHFEPYAKFMIGGGAFNYPTPPPQAQGRFFVVTYGGGLDIPMGRLTLRMVDFEYQQWPGFAKNALTPYGFSFGESFNFSKPKR